MKRNLKRFWTTWLPHIMFWGWNALFFSVTFFSLGPELFKELWRVEMPWSFSLCVMSLLLIPPASMTLGLFWRRQPGRLIRFFYGVEGPLFVLILARLFLMRELNPGMMFMIGVFALALLGYAAYLVGWKSTGRSGSTMGHVAVLTWVLLTGLYLTALLSFYVVPMAGLLAREILKGEWIQEIAKMYSSLALHDAFLATLLVLLLCASLSAFLTLPLALPWLYLEAWRRQIGSYAQVLGRARTVAVSAAVVVLAVGGFALANRQPQRAVFKQLDAFTGAPEEKRRLLAESKRIRRGLVNAYLASYRYVSSVDESSHIRVMFKEIYGGSYETWGGLERVFTVLARPWLYDGDSLTFDRRRASREYAELFDTEIQKGERATIQRALDTTWSQSSLAAGNLEIDARNVRLIDQQVKVLEASSWAEIEIHEVYRNQTTRRQEVLYYFSLPEIAVITGLWLGDTADKSEGYKFVVSPRGAAQAVYRAQVRQRVDPALVEQVGPRQYRLRAFPIPPRSRRQGGDAPEFHLWMTFRVPLTARGWPLPRLIERRNVFWDDGTVRRVDGGSNEVDGWLPAYLSKQGALPSRFEATVAGYRVTARRQRERAARDLPKGALAVVVDTSRSMAENRDELALVMHELGDLASRQRHDVDLYVTDSMGKARRLDRVGDLNLDEEIFFGALRPVDLVAQYEAARGQKTYQAVLLLTDDGGYDLDEDDVALDEGEETPDEVGVKDPLWMVHLGGALPVAYVDALLATMETSGGGVASSLGEALDKMTVPAEMWAADGYVWSVERTGVPEAAAPKAVRAEVGFERVAARQLIKYLSRGASKGDLSQLDTLHGIAKEQAVVTPYSSMIVLVNQSQRQALDRAEKAEDRFEREAESGKEGLTLPSNPFEVSGVPEPEEWILLLMAGLALFYLRIRQLG